MSSHKQRVAARDGCEACAEASRQISRVAVRLRGNQSPADLLKQVVIFFYSAGGSSGHGGPIFLSHALRFNL